MREKTLTAEEKTKRRNSVREIAMFSLLPLGMFFINSTVYTVINVYMTDVLSLSMGLVSIVLLGTKAWDAVNDPIIGVLVEKTRTKWGKCRPWILWMSVPLAVITALLFLPIPFSDKFNIVNSKGEVLGNGMNFAYMLLTYMLFITFYTAVEIPFNSLNPLVFPEEKSRVKAISVSNTVGSLGTVLPSVLIWAMIGFLGNGAKNRTDMGYFWASLIFSVIGAAIMLFSFAKIKEKVYIPPRKINAKKALKTILSDKRMIVLLLCSFFCGMINIGAMFVPYFAKWNCIGILPMDKINAFLEGLTGKNPNLDAVSILPTILNVMSGISYMLSMLLIPLFLRKMNKKKLWIGMSLISAVFTLFTYIMGVYLLPYNTLAGFVVYAVLRFFTNFPVGMSVVLSISMFADVTDAIEMETGERLEATAYSFKGLTYKLAVAIFNVVVLLVIDALHYDADLMTEITANMTTPLISSTTEASVIGGVNYTTLLNGIFFMLTAFGAIGMALQAIPMFFYKFDETKIADKLAAFRERKKQQMQQTLLEALAAAEAGNGSMSEEELQKLRESLSDDGEFGGSTAGNDGSAAGDDTDGSPADDGVCATDDYTAPTQNSEGGSAAGDDTDDSPADDGVCATDDNTAPTQNSEGGSTAGSGTGACPADDGVCATNDNTVPVQDSEGGSAAGNGGSTAGDDTDDSPADDGDCATDDNTAPTQNSEGGSAAGDDETPAIDGISTTADETKQ